MKKYEFISVNTVIEVNNILNSCPSAWVHAFEYNGHGYGLEAIVGNKVWFINNGGDMRDYRNEWPYWAGKACVARGEKLNKQIYNLLTEEDKYLIGDELEIYNPD